MVDDVERESEADMMKGYLRAIMQEPRSPGAGQAYPSQESIPTFDDMKHGSSPRQKTITDMLDTLADDMRRLFSLAISLNDRISGESRCEPEISQSCSLRERVGLLQQLAVSLEIELRCLSESL